MGVTFFIIFCLIAIIFFISLFYLKRLRQLEILQRKVKELEANLKTLDDQARLIVKTDVELSQKQEELRRSVLGLVSLQTLSKDLSSSLEEDKVFSNITEELIAGLGFELGLVVILDSFEPILKVAVGCPDKDQIKEFLAKVADKKFLGVLSREKIILHTSLAAAGDFIGYFNQAFKQKSFIASVIRTKQDVLGLIILAHSQEEEIFEGSREVVEILATQIAQALENIRLFEKLYSSQKELEDKIKQRTKDLELALEQVKKASDLKSEFVSAVSHELRTPLTSVKGYASLLVQEKFGKLPQEVKLRLERINQQADSLVEMINGLLDIARIEAGRTKIEVQRLNLSELIKEVADSLLPQIQEKKIELEFKLPSELAVEADRKLIQRVLGNLLSNAIKFTPSGKKITIIAGGDKDYVEVIVKDQGIGIPEDDLQLIFKEFYRVESQEHKAVKGTGLGLSLVRNIINAHKGEIKAESISGQGASFIFTLPVTKK